MSKKTYISPAATITVVETACFLCESGVYSKNADMDMEIPYGGVDEDGEKVPGTRRYRKDAWEDEELEEECEDY